MSILDTHSDNGDRLCIHCNQVIPSPRLKAMPNASACVPCLESRGDVLKTKRYDDHVGKDGEEVVEIYYRGFNPYIEMRILALKTAKLSVRLDDDPADIVSYRLRSIRPSSFTEKPFYEISSCRPEVKEHTDPRPKELILLQQRWRDEKNLEKRKQLRDEYRRKRDAHFALKEAA